MVKLNALCFFLFSFIINTNSFGQCNADFSYHNGYVNGSIMFKDSGSNSNSIHQLWNWGDGHITSVPDGRVYVSHLYDSSGWYNVCRIIYDSSKACRDTFCDSILVKRVDCKAKFETIVVGDTHYFINRSMNFIETNWSAGYKIHPSGVVTFKDLDTLMYVFNDTNSLGFVSLRVTDSTGKCISESSLCVKPNLAKKFFTLQRPSSLIVRATSFLPSENIRWDFGDSSNSSQWSSPVAEHKYSSFKNYKVCLFSLDSSATKCPGIWCDTINMDSISCSADFVYKITNNTIKLTCKFDDARYRSWYFNGNYVSNQKEFTTVFDTTTSLSVKLVTRNNILQCSNRMEKCVYNVQPSWTAVTSYNHDKQTLHAYFVTPTSGPYYNWTLGTGDMSYKSRFSYEYPRHSKYEVCLQPNLPRSSKCYLAFLSCDTLDFTIDTNDCKKGYLNYFVEDSAQNYKKIHFAHYKGKYTSQSKVIPHKFYRFTAPQNAKIYGLSFVNINWHEPVTSIRAIAPDTIYTNYVTNSVRCPESTSRTIILDTAKTACQSKFNVSLDTTQKFKIILNNNASNFTSHKYYWDWGDGTMDSLRNPTHRFNTFGKFNICLTVFDTTKHCLSNFCDSIGIDSSGKRLKIDGFEIVVEEGNLSTNQNVQTLESFKLYPNPTCGVFSIELSNDVIRSGSINVHVLDVLGKNILTKKFDGSNLQLDLSSVVDGMYYIQITHSHGTIKTRVLKQ